MELYALEANLEPDIGVKIARFFAYVDDFWINRVRVEPLSVYGAVCSTNNFVESGTIP
jgi:hypothetical protein